MTIKECTELLRKVETILQETYPGSNPWVTTWDGREIKRCRFAWEVRLGAGIKSLETAIQKIGSAVHEAQPDKLCQDPQDVADTDTDAAGEDAIEHARRTR